MLHEPVSYNSGTNFLMTSVMVLVLFILISFIILTIFIDEKYIRLKFGYGIFTKKFLLNEIFSVQILKNNWYYGWGLDTLFCVLCGFIIFMF
jgi:hypothetical protein